jgi:hypothetical protein
LVILRLLAMLVAPVTPKTALPNAMLVGATVNPTVAAGAAGAMIVLSSATRVNATTIVLNELQCPL